MLPIYLQKKIISYLCNQDKVDYFNVIRNAQEFIWRTRYAFVNKQWFDLVKDIINSTAIIRIDNKMFHSIITKARETTQQQQQQQQPEDYRILSIDLIGNIIMQYTKHLNDETIELLNKEYKSLQSIKIVHSNDEWIGKATYLLNCLNKLERKQDIQVSFSLTLACFDPEVIEPTRENSNQEAFTFNTNHFQLKYDYECDFSYGFIYKLIKDLNPRSLEFYSDSTTDSGSSHFRMFHSLSKLNNRFESIQVKYDFIPLYALYRFLQSPHLKTFKFELQFHFLSSLYRKFNDVQDFDFSTIDFNQMDKFEFIDTPALADIVNEDDRYQVHQMDYYVKHPINEDQQCYCAFNINCEDEMFDTPPYSLPLWKHCLQLLKSNTTLREFSIGSTCSTSCEIAYKSIKPQVFDDLLDSLSNNKSITTLTFDLDHYLVPSIYTHEFFSTLLKKNKTLETIILVHHRRDRSELDAFVQSLSTTLSTKCIFKTR